GGADVEGGGGRDGQANGKGREGVAGARSAETEVKAGHAVDGTGGEDATQGGPSGVAAQSNGDGAVEASGEVAGGVLSDDGEGEQPAGASATGGEDDESGGD